MHDQDQDILNLRAALHDFEAATAVCDDHSRDRSHLRRECTALATTVAAILEARDRDRVFAALVEELRVLVGTRDEVTLAELMATNTNEDDVTRAMRDLGFELWTKNHERTFVRRTS